MGLQSPNLILNVSSKPLSFLTSNNLTGAKESWRATMASLAFLLICSGALSRPFTALFVRTTRYNQETALLALCFLVSFHSTNSPRANSFRPRSTALISTFVGLTSGTSICLISSRSRLISLTSLCSCLISRVKLVASFPKSDSYKR